MFDVELLPAGEPMIEQLDGCGSEHRSSAWSLSGWIKPTGPVRVDTLLATLSAAEAGPSIAMRLDPDAFSVVFDGQVAHVRTALPAGRWTFFALGENDGSVWLDFGGRRSTRRPARLSDAAITTLTLSPVQAGAARFGGRLARLRWRTCAAEPADLSMDAGAAPDERSIAFTSNSPHWPTQMKQQLGQETPQPVSSLPVGRAPITRPTAKPAPSGPTLVADGPSRWRIARWQLAAAPDVRTDGAAVSTATTPAAPWIEATVPGTVLTTLVDRGVYPDPTFGLNNLAIPEALARQDYWYRTTFVAPARAPGRQLWLRFDGINYAGEIWVNGQRVGTTRGAFVRGRFDVTGLIAPGTRAVVAVRVSPPPHPGLAHEESMIAGAGENGGMMVLDGPTFVATEGWDWIPSVRDRNTGLWQGVGLEESGAVSLGDPQIVTTLPLADNSIADLTITAPVLNRSNAVVVATVTAAFDQVALARTITLGAHEERVVRFDPATDPVLAIRHPRLWWPNGYGEPALHDLALTVVQAGGVSDRRRVRFGLREISYETSLVDKNGDLRRVLIDPSRDLGHLVVDTRHEALRKVVGGWAPSLTAGGEASPSVSPLADRDPLSPFLVLRVNGVRIAARGGNWGMDDLMKRVDRARLEPYFRLHRDANINIIRNWVGQNTEDLFFDLADEYGMLVLNDFWESTQNYNQQADDTGLFIANATDVVRRFRTHPSIVAWIGRNEGVPQPTLNEALAGLVATEDGTRPYLPSSNRINLAPSGPYDWREPQSYFDRDGRGFAIEIGTPSFPTLETWQRTLAPADRWPIGDAWAYHDWHQDGFRSVAPYMAAMATRFGAPSDLGDFARKAQLLQFEAYRAIFEGMNAGLWKTTSGRLLWMSHPAWPSSMWAMYGADYDTPAAYFAVKSASEPVHVQLNLPDRTIALVNNTRQPLAAVRVHAVVLGLDGRILRQGQAIVDAPAGAVVVAVPVAPDALAPDPIAIIRLEATSADGRLLSRNTYWQGRTPADLQAMNRLPQVALIASAAAGSDAPHGERLVTVTLANPARVPVVQAKMTLYDAGGRQMLPVYYEDNYVTLLPGERREIAVHVPRDVAGVPDRLTLRGWNVTPAQIKVTEAGE